MLSPERTREAVRSIRYINHTCPDIPDFGFSSATIALFDKIERHSKLSSTPRVDIVHNMLERAYVTEDYETALSDIVRESWFI